MDDDEADQVLHEHYPPLAAGLTALANGWPAVIGLAGVTRTDLLPGDSAPEELHSAPEELYAFFAEEIYRGLDVEIQIDLGVLIVATTLDREVAEVLLGADRAARSIAEALAVGILDERGTRLDFHPLARAFVEARTHPEAVSQRSTAIGSCLRIYQDRRDWDSAFELVERSGETDHLDAIIPLALDSLLESGRLATIEALLRLASGRGETSPVLKLAAAELGARRGQLAVAETMIQGALRQVEPGSDLQSRAWNVAGQVAHLASREADGLDFFCRAEAAAHDEPSRREARWGRLMTMTALERDEARQLLYELAHDVRVDDPRERVRLTGKRISFALRFGELPKLAEARHAEQLLGLVGDPSVRCSFRSVYSSALVLSANYQDAFRVAQELVDDAERNHVDFGLTYGHSVSALALAGSRRFEDAHVALDSSLSTARQCTDEVGEQNVYATRVRILLQEGRLIDALSLEPPDVTEALLGIRGEVMASRGLALACAGRAEDASFLAQEASRTTQSLEVAVLTAAIRAVVEVRARGEAAFGAVESLLDVAIERGGLDLFVTCYRASPDVLSMLLASARTSEQAVFALVRAGDQHLAEVLGSSPEVIFDPFTTLSRREREVYALLCEGMSDREIGRLLFIAPGTAKRHALQILRKMGFKSRRALMLEAVRRRVDHAAPTATRDKDSSDS
jgi:DNA-binding NarL/FixJ family response regulator